MTRDDRIEELKKMFIMTSRTRNSQADVAQRLSETGQHKSWVRQIERENKALDKFVSELGKKLTAAGVDIDSLKPDIEADQ